MSEPRVLHDDNGESAEFYQLVLTTLTDAGVPFVLGGTYAMERLAGISRQTKDLDLFIVRDDWPRIERALAGAGLAAQMVFPHWLAKVERNNNFVDLIFAGGNSLVRVDEEWINYGTPSVVLGVPVRISPAEEMIWSKAYVMERERFDGADVLHILRRSGRDLDWSRLLRRFGSQGAVLLAHLVLFMFVYPDAADIVPEWVLDGLWGAHRVLGGSADRECRGTLFSRAQYLVDIHGWGYADARLRPRGHMTDDEISQWTAAIDDAMVPSPM